jgi:hypothetical protein
MACGLADVDALQRTIIVSVGSVTNSGEDPDACSPAQHAAGLQPCLPVAYRARMKSSSQQVCLAHLVRDAQYAIEACDPAFASGLRKLLEQTCLHRPSARPSPGRCRRYLAVFLTSREIPPANNGSEQALSPRVIYRKVANCFRSEWATELYADIRSVIETVRRHGVAALDNGLPPAAAPLAQSPAPHPSG